MDKLEKYSIGNAVSYDSFLDRWRPVSEYTGKLPLQVLTSDPAYLDRNRNVEVRDTAFCYFCTWKIIWHRAERYRWNMPGMVSRKF